MLPTIVLANLCPAGPASRCGQLNIGDQVRRGGSCYGDLLHKTFSDYRHQWSVTCGFAPVQVSGIYQGKIGYWEQDIDIPGQITPVHGHHYYNT